jgi:Tol biopolymer transport system component
MIRLATALLLVLGGCTETVQLARDPLVGMVALDVTPFDSTIKITDLAAAHHTLQFSAMGRFEDGTTRDITPLVEWNLDNGLLGAFDKRGLFTASHTAAGHGIVTIEARGLLASTALTVMIDATLIDPAFPPPAANLFDPSIPFVSGDPTRSPTLMYPADGTVFPQDIASTLFQFQRGAGNDAFRVVFDSEVLHLAVETGADRWQADGDLQRLLAATGINGPVRSEVHATASTAVPATIFVGNRITLAFTTDSPGGPLYFWSAATNGIMQGGVDKQASSKLYPDSQTTTCVGCHAVTRTNTQLAMSVDATTTTNLLTIDLTSLAPVISPTAARPSGWSTFSPDGSRVLVANNGVLKLYDAGTGASLGTVPLPAMRYATHPDWSPDGQWVAVALTPQLPTNMDVKSASIARIPYNDGAWGTAQILVSGSVTSNNYFPKFSPQGGAYLAYVRATTTSQGATSAELMLVPSDGGTARRLRIASHRVGPQDDVPDLSNTMPSWAPRQGERTWLAFTSARPFGAVLPTAGRGQIWVTSIDLSSTGDPSSAAFWLPCQDTTVVNNTPVWSTTDSPTI